MTKTVSPARRARAAVLILLGAALWLGAASSFAGEDTVADPPFTPMSPSIMAQGGSSIATVRGYDALFSNPAGFAGNDASLTLLSANPWVYANPARAIPPLIDDWGNALDVISEEIVTGGFGVGASSGIAYVGKGLGLGVSLIVDSYLYGDNLLGASGYAHATVAFIGGYAASFDLLGMQCHVGAALRPMFRIHAPLSNQDLLEYINLFTDAEDMFAALSEVDVLHGIGLGVDAGAVVDLGNLKLAVAARDIGGTKFVYNASEMGDVLQSFEQGFPKGTPVEGAVSAIPMNLSVGAALDPDSGFLTQILDPVFHVELRDLLGVIHEKKSPWTLLHIGAQLRVFSLISLRAGLYQGYLTMGAGLNLGIAEVNAAVFCREMGRHLMDRPNAGMTAEVALRF